MYLKQIKISGFKSFADVYSINFNPGLTAIVGPNGCGKSNIIDAIRWVLGEQRTKILRCEKMEDVIFSGTMRRKPLNFTEVTLIVENEDKVLPAEYDSAHITRRIFRTGESEYLINKKICRLRDITGLFYDTGMGIGSYSLMEQKMIETLLSDKDEERRTMFEEAAGINKYRSQRKEALKNLLKTAEDLTRITDMANEKEHTVRMLARHVVKAEKYREFKRELTGLDLAVTWRVFHEVSEKIKETGRDHAALMAEKEKMAAQISSADATVEQQELHALQREEALQQASRELSAMAEKAHEIENAGVARREKIEGALRAIAQNEQYQVKLDETIRKLQTEEAEARSRLIQLDTSGREAEAEHHAARGAFDAFEQEVAGKRAALADAQQARMRLIEEETELRTRLEKIKSDTSNLFANRLDVERGMAEGKKRSDDCQGQILVCRDSLTQASSEFSNLTASRDRLVSKIQAEEYSFRDILEEEKNLEANLISDEKRLEFFEQEHKNHEGYKGAVRAAVESGIEGIRGIVADVIDVDPKYMAGIESALGSRVQFVLADSQEAAHEAIRRLREGRLGKASFVVRSAVTGKKRPPLLEDLSGIEGVIGWADRHVAFRGEYGDLASLLLGDVLLVRDASVAGRIKDRCADFPVYCITPEGDVHTTNGIVRGGEFGNEQPGLLSRGHFMDALKDNVRKYREKIGEKEREKRSSLSTLEEAKRALFEIDEKLNSGRRLKQEQEGNIRHLDEEMLRLQARENEALERMRVINGRLEEITAEEGNILQAMAGLERKKGEADGGILLLNQELTGLEERRPAVTEKVKNAELSLSGIRQEAAGVERAAARMAGEVTAAFESINAQREEKSRTEAEIENYRADIQEFERQLRECSASRQQQELQVQKRRDDLAALRVEIGNLRKVSREREKVMAGEVDKLHQCELELQKLNDQKRAMVERIWEEYEKDLNALGEEERQLAQPEEEARQKIEVLRKRLKAIGPNVNLSVLEDYESEKKTFDELAVQKTDLEGAKAKLEQLIRKLDREASEKFIQTFNQVRENFRMVFLELFEGGEADLRLEEHEDPLQAKIAIYARPSGKSMKNIQLLSGGEKALTATSLLFGLYLVKPSPYCILDEVDGPLDDANIGRFIRLIRRFSEKTQFLVITHNKKTMAACDLLYGVTLAEPGVSKLVSVSLATESDEKKIDELIAQKI